MKLVGGQEGKEAGLSKDSVPMAASFQNSLGMKNNENHSGEKSDPGRRVLTSGWLNPLSPGLPEGSSVGQGTIDPSSPHPPARLSGANPLGACRRHHSMKEPHSCCWRRETMMGKWGRVGTRLKGSWEGTVS